MITSGSGFPLVAVRAPARCRHFSAGGRNSTQHRWSGSCRVSWSRTETSNLSSGSGSLHVASMPTRGLTRRGFFGLCVRRHWWVTKWMELKRRLIMADTVTQSQAERRSAGFKVYLLLSVLCQCCFISRHRHRFTERVFKTTVCSSGCSFHSHPGCVEFCFLLL